MEERTGFANSFKQRIMVSWRDCVNGQKAAWRRDINYLET
jgi:hypothetical protein